MAWATKTQTGTKHKTDCHRVFNHYDNTCARCIELRNGAQARAGWGDAKREQERKTLAAITAHFTNHETKGCGPVCTAFEH